MEGSPDAYTPTCIDRTPLHGDGWRDEPFFLNSRFNSDGVFVGEIGEIIKRRMANGVKLDGLEGARKPAPRLGLVGLALSGGGIRSATFNLGVLQRLVEEGLLHHVDYLSTVSGGGYVGACLASMLAAHERRPLPLRHVQGRTEQDAFRHLRNFSNYLAPGGVREVLRIPALVVQGVLVNLLYVLPYILIAAILLSLSVWWMAPPPRSYLGLPMTGIGAAFFLVVIYLAVALPSWQHWRERRLSQDQRWWIRDKQANLARWGLLFGPLAFVLLQPAILIKVANEGWLAPFAAVSGLGSAGLAVALGQRAAQRLPGLVDKLLVIGFALLAPISLWLLTLALAEWLLYPPALIPFPQATLKSGSAGGWSLSLAAIYTAAAVLVWCYAFRILDANKTSFHAFYRDRLSKTYMFNPHRDATIGEPCDGGYRNEADLRHTDRIRLKDLPDRGPYHLINAAINIQNSKRNLRGRNADPFLFSRLYCGGELTGYCKTEDLERQDPHLDLATAMAISGAAAAPNMGLKTNRAWTFTLAMANVRLGYWLRNPCKLLSDGVPQQTATEQEGRRQPRAGRRYFFKELFGWLTDEDDFVYVSDGGHVENLGGLELLRRRCRYIIISDAEADPEMTFNGLAHLMRLARIDLGVHITLDISDIRREPPGTVRSHCAIGTIDYGRDEYGQREFGKLLYIKSSVTGDENEYITEYRSRHPDFPHETTGDQFFDEAQFEAYRALGYHIVGRLFEPRRSEDLIESFGNWPGFSSVDKWFDELTQRLRPRPSDRHVFIELQRQIASIERRLVEPEFASYSKELYPELGLSRQKEPAAIGHTPARVGLEEDVASFAPEVSDETRTPAAIPIALGERERPVLHLVNEQLQLMERAVLQLGLDVPRRRLRPSNRGFMNLFRRWSQSDRFRRAWAVSISNYSRDLQRFSDEALDLRLSINWTPWQEGVSLRDIFEHARQIRSKTKLQPEAADEEGIRSAKSFAELSSGHPMPRELIRRGINCFEWKNVLSHLWDLSDKRRWAPVLDVSGRSRAPCLLIAWAGVAQTPGVTSEKADKLRFLVGFAVVLDDETEPVVTYIRVRDTYRGLGLGARLAERLAEALKSSYGEQPALQFATADKSDMSAAMRSIFERLGYTEVPLRSDVEVSAME